MSKIKLYPVPAAMEIEVPRGMVFTGKVVRDTAGNILPVFESAPPKPGELSINTRDGWNAHVRKGWILHARGRLGHEPSEEEIQEQRILERRFIDAVIGAETGAEPVDHAEIERLEIAAYGADNVKRFREYAAAKAAKAASTK